jgi:site-specific recombinase XerD
MFLTPSERIFDTLIDTHKNRVSMIRTKFTLRKDFSVAGEHPIYLHITGGGHKRERIHTQLFVKSNEWNDKQEQIIGKGNNLIDKQLILEKIKSKLSEINITYRLSDMVLTPEVMRNEYENKLSRINFVSFFKEALEDEASSLEDGTYARYVSVHKKLSEYNNFIPFNTINLTWFKKYRTHLSSNLGNLDTTINSNISAIKKFLRIAQKNGVKLLFNLEDVQIGNTNGNRNYLNAKELNACLNYYYSPFINPSYRLILGYFLFSCMTGLRISNVQGLIRKNLLDSDFSVIFVKGNKDKNLTLNETVKKIVLHDKDLFETKFTDQHINDELKKIMKFLGINKKISFHVARHTFATLFLKMGGKIQNLQQLLGHSSISTTMIYSHIILADANEEVFLLDKIFKIDKAV